MSFDWDDLKVVLAVSRTGSMARAATGLKLDQSTVSRKLSGLEAAFGAALFKRSKKGLQPTELGSRILPLAIEAEQVFENIAAQAIEDENEPSGLVRILSNAWILDRLAEYRLPAFLEAFPAITVRLLSKEPVVSVQSDATISLWFEALPSNGDLAEPLGAVPFALYCAAQSDETIVDWVSFYDEDFPKRAPVRYLQDHKVATQQLRITALDAQLVRTAIRAGIGKGFLPMCLGENDPLLKRISGLEPAFFRVLHIHVHPDTRQSPRAQVAISMLNDCFDTVFLP